MSICPAGTYNLYNVHSINIKIKHDVNIGKDNINNKEIIQKDSF